MGDITCEVNSPEQKDADDGTYYLRTNVTSLDEKTIWDYYHLIKDIECTNRQLKTSLRPIYHQKDENSDAHFFFGLLAYWMVNTIRHQLEQGGFRHYWTEIVRKTKTMRIAARFFIFVFLWLIAAIIGRIFGFWQTIKKKNGLINRLLTRC